MEPRKPVDKEGDEAARSPAPDAERAIVLPDRERALTAEEFRHLTDVPPEVEWFANITNPRTRRAYTDKTVVWTTDRAAAKRHKRRKD